MTNLRALWQFSSAGVASPVDFPAHECLHRWSVADPGTPGAFRFVGSSEEATVMSAAATTGKMVLAWAPLVSGAGVSGMLGET